MERTIRQSSLGGDLGSLAHADILHAWLIAVGGTPTVVNTILGINGTGHVGNSRGHDMDLQQHATQHTCGDPISLHDELHP
jgi:hypothetical protein